MIPESAVEAAARALDFHLPDKAHEMGCALRCDYDGDDLTDHLVRHILEAAAPHMLAGAWDDGFTTCANEHTFQRLDSTHPITRENPYRTAE